MTVTIGVKTLNEEVHVEAALRSALRAVAPVGGTVLLADSGSTDRTIAIAKTLPVRIVQLADPAERSCGAGAQLAFQYAGDDYFCLIDGDMTIVPGFIEAGLAYLAAHPDVAGVGGHVTERDLATQEFQIRAAAMTNEAHRRPGLVDRLDGGGIYRTAAVRQTGYFSDRNLRSFEEFELAMRLAGSGWKLARIDVPAIEHYGHTGGSYALLLRRLRSGQFDGAGQVLRAALGRRHLPLVVRRLGHLHVGAAIILWWAALAASAFLAPVLLLALLLVPIAYLSVRRGSLGLGFFSFCLWNLTVVGMIHGFCRGRTPTARPLAANELSPPAPGAR